MSFPKNKKRLIQIDDTKYCWLVGPNDGYNVFFAQKDNSNGRKIMVFFETYSNTISSEFPKVKDLVIIKPKEAETIIRQAIQIGWNPEEKGNDIVYDLVNNKIIER